MLSLAINISIDGKFIFAMINVLIACGCFLLGVNQMSNGFLNVCIRNNSGFIKLFRTDSRLKGVFGGVLHSGFTQSSDATTVFTIRLINVGAITLIQGACIIMGANIGTTLTGFIVSLSSFNISPYLACLVFPGAIILLSNNPKTKAAGQILTGFGVLFVGIELLDNYIQDEAIRDALVSLFTISSRRWVLLIVGFVLTAILQSSSVSTTIVIFMFGKGLISMQAAFFVCMGANIGTCVTEIIAATRANGNAKRIAMIHLFFNLFGAAVFTAVMYYFSAQFLHIFEIMPIGDEFKISIFCLLFNTATMFILLPFVRPICWFTKVLIKD